MKTAASSLNWPMKIFHQDLSKLAKSGPTADRK